MKNIDNYHIFYLIVKFHHVIKGFNCELNLKTPFNAFEKTVVSKAEPWFEINS
jgi:hypothetical protein